MSQKSIESIFLIVLLTCLLCSIQPVSGQWSDWGQWTSCTRSCNNGTQTSTRTCTTAPCPGSATQTRQCNVDPCPVDGGWSSWATWGACNPECGDDAWRSRIRTCTNPIPQFGGRQCDPAGQTEMEPCTNLPACEIDGGWSEWTAWSTCSVTCGTGNQTSTRLCNNPTPSANGLPCSGSGLHLQKCVLNPCPINGNWGSWSAWTCSVTCGNGTQTRKRNCDSPAPQYNGLTCSGSANDTGVCSTPPCPINGQWTTWTSWTTCSVTCGAGKTTRTRSCTNPAPAYGGTSCPGAASDEQACNMTNCPIDGQWSAWTDWVGCSTTCGNGTDQRTRTCSNPPAQFGGLDCVGTAKETKYCNLLNCPIDGNWAGWGNWSKCSVSCGPGGVQLRYRTCTNPAPLYNGKTCPGSSTDQQTCNANIYCPVDGYWNTWNDWSACSISCGAGGNRTRTRTCVDPKYGGAACQGAAMESGDCLPQAECPVDGYWSNWSNWTVCSVSCGTGTKTRSRTCTQPLYGGKACSGSALESTSCSIIANCPVDGVWSSWTSWSTCSKSCSTGYKVRSRTCTQPLYGGLACPGSALDNTTCTLITNCPIDGGLSKWTDWADCSVTCGGGWTSRTRQCNNPTPQYGGQTCTGDLTQTITCNNFECPVDGQWSDWTDWSSCSVTCGKGSRTRLRYCNNPEPQYGGDFCIKCLSDASLSDTDLLYTTVEPLCSVVESSIEQWNGTLNASGTLDQYTAQFVEFQECELSACNTTMESQVSNMFDAFNTQNSSTNSSDADVMKMANALVNKISEMLAAKVVGGGPPVIINAKGISVGLSKPNGSKVSDSALSSNGMGGVNIGSAGCPAQTDCSDLQLKFSTMDANKIIMSGSAADKAAPVLSIKMEAGGTTLGNASNVNMGLSLPNQNNQTEDSMLEAMNISNSQKMIQKLTAESPKTVIKLSIRLENSSRILMMFSLNRTVNYTWQANVTAFIDETGFVNATQNGTLVVKVSADRPYVRVFVPANQLTQYDTLYMTSQMFPISSDGSGSLTTTASGKSSSNSTRAHFSIGVALITPRSWSDKLQLWEDANVDVDEDSSIEQVKFKSNFFGAFSSKMFIGPNTIDFADVFGNFGAKLADSFAVLLTIIIIFVAYTITGVYMWRLDRQEADLLRFEPLVDNEASYEYTYIVTFYTSNLAEAGTTANVFFNLAGSWGTSGQHLCHDGWRKNAFYRGAVVNFVLTTEASLGDLRALRVWHDGTGDFPAWHLEKVLIEDVQTHSMNVFMCDQWLAEDRFDGERERVLCEIKQDEKFQEMFLSMKMGGVMDKHVFVSLTRKTGDSSYTRLQRLSVCIAMFFLMMVSNAMYFGKDDNLPAEANFKLDFGPISMSWFQLYTSIISISITYPCIFVCAEIFRRTKRWKRRWTEDEMANQRKEIRLPRGFLVLGWALLLMATIVAAFFVFLYSLSWGNAKSTDWLMTFLTGLVGMVFMTDPLILLLLYVVIKKIFRVNEEENTMELDQFISEDVHQALGHEMRARNQEKMAEMQKEKINSQKLSRTVMDMISYMLFTFLLTALAYDARDQLTYRQNNMLKNYFIDSSASFSTFQDVYDYLNNTAIPAIYPDLMYNGDPRTDDLAKSISVCDCMRQGPFRLRQIRARKDACTTPYPMGPLFASHNCYPYYALDTSDKGVYDPEWLPYSKPEFNRTSWKKRSPSILEATLDAYRYQSPEDSGGYAFEGTFGIYEGGGFVANLGLKSHHANAILNNLKNVYWMDRQTRAVFLEGTVFNWYTNLFTTVTVLFEFPPGGGVNQFQFGVRTYRLYNYVPGKGFVLMIMQGAFCLIIILNLIREIRKIVKERGAYFTDNWNKVELLSIGLAIAIMLTTGIRIKLTIDAIELMMNNKGFYVAFDNVATWVEITCILMALSSFVCILRVLKYLGFNKHIAVVQATIAHSTAQLSSFGIVMAVFAVAYFTVGTILFTLTEQLFADPLVLARSLFGSFLGVILYTDMFGNTAGSLVTMLYYYTWVTLSLFILMSVFMSILNDTYSSVLENELFDYDQELVDHMWNQFTKMVQTVNTTVQAVVKRKPKGEDSHILSTASIRVELNDYRTKEDRYKKVHPTVQQRLAELNNDKIDLEKLRSPLERGGSFMSCDSQMASSSSHQPNVLIKGSELTTIYNQVALGGGVPTDDNIPRYRRSRQLQNEESDTDSALPTGKSPTANGKETFRLSDGNALTIPMPNTPSSRPQAGSTAGQPHTRGRSKDDFSVIEEDEFNC